MRIAVAMSGGVDSSVAALLLAREGHEVIGLSMRLWDASREAGRTSRCCAAEDLSDARKAAWTIGIPHYVLDLEEEFTESVVRPFVESYAAGETPIPCSACNTRVKFATLRDRARAFGCDAIATGHYARRDADPATGRPRLLRGRDRAKDQSYFLWDLDEDQLGAALFPVGDLDKARVREIARDAALPNAEKEESQEICFVPRGERAGDFVADEARRFGIRLPAAGSVETSRGEKVGDHEGHFRFTIGQRRGLGVAASSRLYVLSIDPAENRVVVGAGEELETREARVGGVRVRGVPAGRPFRASARIRHRGSEVSATVTPLDGEEAGAAVLFDEPVRACAPGQSCVFYDGDVVLGGGVLVRQFAGSLPSATTVGKSDRISP